MAVEVRGVQKKFGGEGVAFWKTGNCSSDYGLYGGSLSLTLFCFCHPWLPTLTLFCICLNFQLKPSSCFCHLGSFTNVNRQVGGVRVGPPRSTSGLPKEA